MVRGAGRSGFTLIELIAVLVVLAILSGVAIPKYMDMRWEAQVSAAQGARSALATAVTQAHLDSAADGGAGAYPGSIAFALEGDDSKHLYNPWWTPGIPVYIDDPNAGPEKVYVQVKMIDRSPARGAYGAGAIWYNPTNGRVNFRVPERGSNAETLELFNLVNQGNVTRMRQTTAR